MSQVDLVIPGLLNLPLNELDRQELSQQAPALSHLLRFARQIPNRIYDFDQLLSKRLGLRQPGLPYAHSIQARNDDNASLMVKALHLRPDINNAVLYPLELHNDKNIIINELKDYFKVDCDISAEADDYWLMHLHDIEASTIPITPHYLSVLGKQISAYLPQLRSSLPWYKLLNEMQMFMHQHQLNQQRLVQGLPIVNSLWCWGSAHYADEFYSDTSWYSDDWLLQRLGQLYTGQSQPISAVADNGIRQDTIIVDLTLLRLLKGEVDGDLQQLLIKLDQQCLQPLLESPSRHIWLHTAGSKSFYYRPLHRWKLWKKTLSVLDVSDKDDTA